jgi:Domain of unknown function (DUF4939)
VQEYTIIIKIPDIFYKDQTKLNNFLISIDIYILFNQYLFNSESAKIIYIISYFRGIAFNWVKTYINDFMIYKTIKGKITTATKDIT